MTRRSRPYCLLAETIFAKKPKHMDLLQLANAASKQSQAKPEDRPIKVHDIQMSACVSWWRGRNEMQYIIHGSCDDTINLKVNI